MPVSVMCDAASVVNAALRESIGNSSNNTTNCSTAHHNNEDDGKNNLQNKLIASAKRVLLTKIEYEEVNNYNQTVIDTLKSKYIVLKPTSNGNKVNQLTTAGDSDNKEANQNTSATPNTTISGHQNGSKESSNQLPQPKRVLYPKENVQIGWRNSNRKWQIGTGMVNVGNTCYLNSTLQALFHVPAMANWLISDSSHREKCEDENGLQGGCIICAMSKTLIASQTSQSPIRPYLVYTKLKLVCKHLIMGRQEDAHEFLRYLVEAMEKSYLSRFRNWKELDQFSKETTPLNQILGGYLRSTVRCLACGHVSTTFQHFQDLLLDIRKANTVEEALDGYFARERLEDMGYKCEACKKKVSATKQFSLERAPVSLCIQLKRFSMMGTKLNKHVAIRPRLDLSPHASRKSSNGEQLTYRLVAMVTHLGASQHCGHYTAIGVTDAGGYYQFDDSCVRPISLQNVLNTNAYIIFYELEDPHQQQQYSLPTTLAGSKLTSTQVSGEHNRQLSHTSILEQIKENIHNKMNGQLIHNNNENVKQNNSSIQSKGTPSTSSNTSATIIGPQLPDKLLNGCKPELLKPSLNGLLNSTTTHHKLIKSPLNSSSNINASLSTSATTTTTSIPQSSPKQKPSNSQQSLSHKLVIHFKNTSNNSVNSSGNSISNPMNAKFQGISSPSKSQLVDSSKAQAENISNKSIASASTSNATVKTTLPSMPNLESPSQKNNTLVSPSSSSSPLVRSSSNKNGTANVAENSTNKPTSNHTTIRNSNKISPIKSLVPYESDDESSSDSDSEQQRSNVSKTLNNTSCNSSNNSVHSSNKSNYIVLDDSSSSSSSSHTPDKTDRKPKTPPSPAVVKSKTGLWQVTSANVPHHTTTTAPATAAASSSSSEKRNPFASSSDPSLSTGISTSSFYTSKMNSRDRKFNGSNNKKYEGGYTENHNNSGSYTVNQLLKFSHRGYGAPVLSWNGQRTEMEKELSEENRLERKRELKDDEENEMDRGRQKKIKTHNNNNNFNCRDNSSGYNPFQEYQNNQQQRRWNNNTSSNSNNNNNNNGSGNGNGRYHNQNGHNNNNILYNRQNNPFYRNHNNNNNSNFRNRSHNNNNNHHHHRFNNHHHQRPHHQRNGGGGNNRFHHRRDS